MATGLLPLRLLQFGFEATVGSGAVAATHKAIGKAGLKPIIDWAEEDFPRGVRMPVDEIIAVMKGGELTVESDLDTEQVLWPLSSGLQEGAIVGAGPYVYTHELVTTPTLRSVTAEFVVDDGSTKHYEREFAYMLTKQFQISIVRNQVAKLAWTMFGRAEQTSTVTPALTAVTRARIPSNLFKLYIDPAWASLGGTQKTGTLLEAVLTVPTGLAPDYTLDGRTDLDMVMHMYQQAKPTLMLKMRHNANAATEVGNWRTGTRRYIRLISDNGAAAGANRKFQIDASARLLSWEFGDEDGQEVITSNWTIVYDTVGAHGLVIPVTSGLATLAAL